MRLHQAAVEQVPAVFGPFDPESVWQKNKHNIAAQIGKKRNQKFIGL
jgi:hypothetical protein